MYSCGICIRRLTAPYSADLPDEDEDDDDSETAKIRKVERLRIHEQLSFELPPVDVEEAERPFGKGSLSVEELDLSFLIQQRELHQTRQAEQGTRTREGNSHIDAYSSRGIQMALVSKVQALLRERQVRGGSTGTNRTARWIEGPAEPAATGNAANAAVVAVATVRKTQQKRAKIFKLAGVPFLSMLSTARISGLRPLEVGDYAIIYGENGFGTAVGKGTPYIWKNDNWNRPLYALYTTHTTIHFLSF